MRKAYRSLVFVTRMPHKLHWQVLVEAADKSQVDMSKLDEEEVCIIIIDRTNPCSIIYGTTDTLHEHL